MCAQLEVAEFDSTIGEDVSAGLVVGGELLRITGTRAAEIDSSTAVAEVGGWHVYTSVAHALCGGVGYPNGVVCGSESCDTLCGP